MSELEHWKYLLLIGFLFVAPLVTISYLPKWIIEFVPAEVFVGLLGISYLVGIFLAIMLIIKQEKEGVLRWKPWKQWRPYIEKDDE